MGSLYRIEGEGESLRVVASPVATPQRGRWVLAPSTEVLLTTAHVPGVAGSARLRAVPFAIEDRVGESLDDLHFAPAAAAEPAGLPVAVVARGRMAEWLAECAAAGVRPSALVPEVLVLPWEGPGSVCVLLTDHRVLVRTGACAGFGVEPDTLEAYLGALGASAGPVTAVDVYDARGDPRVAPSEMLAPLGAPTRTHGHIDDLTAWLAARLPRRPPLNLLQGPFEARAAWWRPSWAAAAALLALWIGAQSLVGALETARLRAEAQRLGTHLAELLDPTARAAAATGGLEREIRRMLLASSRPAPDFLGLLMLSAPVLAGVQPLALERMVYEDERIVLDLSLGSPGLLDALLVQLRERGFAVDVLSLVNRDTEVECRLRLGRAR